jgi:hypothetical protein
MRRVIPTALVAAAFALVAGCGGGPIVSSLRVEAPLDPVVRAHKALLVTGTSPKGEWAADARAIASHVAPRLVDTGYFAAVVDDAHAAQTQTDLELRIDVTELVRVTAREREGRGDGAGQTKVVATLRLVDKASGADLGRANVTAAGYTGPHGGTTEDAEDEIARRVIELVSGKHEGG